MNAWQAPTTQSTLEAKWHFIEGAEEYDLEWVYVDKLTQLGADLSTELDGTILPHTVFERKEGAMVRHKDTKYSIDKVFSESLMFPLMIYESWVKCPEFNK